MKHTEAQTPMAAQPDLSLAFVGQSLRDGFATDLSWSTFNNISRGQAQPEDVDQLNALTAVRNLNILRRLIQDVSAMGFDETAGLGFVHSIGSTLEHSEQKDPDTFRATWTYPFFNGFASRVSELLRNKGSQYQMSEQVATRIAYETGATVAAVAIRCNVPCDVKAYVHQDQLVLPSLGALQLPSQMTHATVRRTRDGKVLVSNEAEEFQMELPRDLSQPTTDWQPVRTLHAETEGHAITVALDDLHYNRSAFAENFTDRLSDKTVARWQEHFQGAWEILYSHVPDSALSVAGVLRAIIPYKTQASGYGPFTVSNAAAYRAMGMSIPDKPVSFAKEMLHETSHNILDRLNELLPLSGLIEYDNQGYWSPWRRDPRPLGGHIHGMYAHSVLADFARILAAGATTEEDRQRFTVDFARWRKKTKAAASMLVRWIDVEKLEPTSSTFLACLIRKIMGLQGYAIDERIEKLASDEVTDHYNTWRLTNLQVEPAEISKLVEFFLAGRTSDTAQDNLSIEQDPDLTAKPRYMPPKNRDSFFAKHRLFDMYQEDQAMFRTLVSNPKLLTAFRGVIPPDVAFVNGDYQKALQEYELLVEQHPEAPQYWSGFLIALSCFCPHEENKPLGGLLLRPDILQPVYAGVVKKMAERQLGSVRPSEFVEQFAAMVQVQINKFKIDEANDD